MISRYLHRCHESRALSNEIEWEILDRDMVFPSLSVFSRYKIMVLGGLELSEEVRLSGRSS